MTTPQQLDDNDDAYNAMRNSTLTLNLGEGGNDDMCMMYQQPQQQDNHSETMTMRQQKWDNNNATGGMTAAERLGRALSHCMTKAKIPCIRRCRL